MGFVRKLRLLSEAQEELSFEIQVAFEAFFSTMTHAMHAFKLRGSPSVTKDTKIFLEAIILFEY